MAHHVAATYSTKSSHLSDRVPALDGVRGLAILLVMMHHGFASSFTVQTLGEKIFKLAVGSYGWVGVDLFFVLSGFLITGVLLDAKGRANYFSAFYMRRVLRIFPIYYVSLVIFFLVLPLLFTSLVPAFPLREIPWYLGYAVNYQLAIKTPLGHFWSLCIEEQFYLIWPLLVWLLARRALVRVSVALILLPLLLRVGGYFGGLRLEVLHYWLIMRIDALIYGALIAIGSRSPGLHALRKPMQWIVGGSGIILAGLFAITRGFPRCALTETVGLSVVEMFFAATLVLILTASPSSLWTKTFSSNFLTKLGKYSYALYIFNWPIVDWLRGRLWQMDETLPRIAGSQICSAILFCIGTALLTYLCALVSWHLLEKHFLRLKRYFEMHPKNSKDFSSLLST